MKKPLIEQFGTHKNPLLNENFDKIYNAFNNKDYWDTAGQIKTLIGNWERAKAKGDKGTDDYTKEDIIKFVQDKNREQTLVLYEKIKRAIKDNDINYLKSRLRHDQKVSQAFFMDITGKKLPKTTKEIHKFLEDFFGIKENITEGIFDLFKKKTYDDDEIGQKILKIVQFQNPDIYYNPGRKKWIAWVSSDSQIAYVKKGDYIMIGDGISATEKLQLSRKIKNELRDLLKSNYKKQVLDKEKRAKESEEKYRKQQSDKVAKLKDKFKESINEITVPKALKDPKEKEKYDKFLLSWIDSGKGKKVLQIAQDMQKNKKYNKLNTPELVAYQIAFIKNRLGISENIVNESSNIKVSKDGYVKHIEDPMSGKMVKSVKVNGKDYRYNSAYKTYNSVKGNELLYKNDIPNIRYENIEKVPYMKLKKMIGESITEGFMEDVAVQKHIGIIKAEFGSKPKLSDVKKYLDQKQKEGSAKPILAQVWGMLGGKRRTEQLSEETNGSADDFAKRIEDMMKKYFPNSSVYARYRKGMGELIDVRLAIGQKKDWTSGIVQNAPVEYGALIFNIKDRKTNDSMSLESSTGASVTIKPPEGSYLAYGRVKVPTRKTKGGEEKIFKAIENVIVNLKKATKSNIGNMTDDHQWVKKYL